MATGQEKVREILFFFSAREREFCKMVRKVLHTKEVREKSGNFDPKLLSILSDCFFSLIWRFYFILENIYPKALKHFIFELNNNGGIFYVLK